MPLDLSDPANMAELKEWTAEKRQNSRDRKDSMEKTLESAEQTLQNSFDAPGQKPIPGLDKNKVGDEYKYQSETPEESFSNLSDKSKQFIEKIVEEHGGDVPVKQKSPQETIESLPSYAVLSATVKTQANTLQSQAEFNDELQKDVAKLSSGIAELKEQNAILSENLEAFTAIVSNPNFQEFLSQLNEEQQTQNEETIGFFENALSNIKEWTQDRINDVRSAVSGVATDVLSELTEATVNLSPEPDAAFGRKATIVSDENGVRFAPRSPVPMDVAGPGIKESPEDPTPPEPESAPDPKPASPRTKMPSELPNETVETLRNVLVNEQFKSPSVVNALIDEFESTETPEARKAMIGFNAGIFSQDYVDKVQEQVISDTVRSELHSSDEYTSEEAEKIADSFDAPDAPMELRTLIMVDTGIITEAEAKKIMENLQKTEPLEV